MAASPKTSTETRTPSGFSRFDAYWRNCAIYLIGRVVVFEDPHLSVGMPSMAIHNPDGSVWKNQAGLGWTNPSFGELLMYTLGANAGLLTGWLFHHRLKQWDSDQNVRQPTRFPGYD